MRKRLNVAGIRPQLGAHNRSFSLLASAASRNACHGQKREQVDVDACDKVRLKSRDALFIAASSHRLTSQMSASMLHTKVEFSWWEIHRDLESTERLLACLGKDGVNTPVQ